MRALLLLLLPLLTVALWLTLAARAAAQQQQPDLVPFAQAYNAAWNAHDVEAVLAFFAPDAIVRHRGATIPEGFWARATTLSGAQGRTGGWDHGLAWVRGAAGISDLAERAFRAHAHADTDTYQATGETVTWRYRLSEDPFQQLPRVWPVEGAAEAVVRGGQIVLLSTVHDANSVQRRQLALAAAQGADTAQATPRLQPRQTQDGTEPTTAAWPLALGGLAVLGCLVAVLRGRARV